MRARRGACVLGDVRLRFGLVLRVERGVWSTGDGKPSAGSLSVPVGSGTLVRPLAGFGLVRLAVVLYKYLALDVPLRFRGALGSAFCTAGGSGGPTTLQRKGGYS